MLISDLIIIMQNRINTLNNSRAVAASVGDLETVLSIDTQINNTQISLSQLQKLP